MSDYPSEQTLKLIREWDILKNGIKPLVAIVMDVWHWEDYRILKGNKLQLHTGGWSGNEDIIQALHQNKYFWMVCWLMEKRSGHYWFNVSEIKKNKQGDIKCR